MDPPVVTVGAASDAPQLARYHSEAQTNPCPPDAARVHPVPVRESVNVPPGLLVNSQQASRFVAAVACPNAGPVLSAGVPALTSAMAMPASCAARDRAGKAELPRSGAGGRYWPATGSEDTSHDAHQEASPDGISQMG